MRQRDLIREVETKEILENMAYDMLQDKQFKDNLLKEMSLDAQKNQTPEQERNLVIQMFMRFGMRKPKEK